MERTKSKAKALLAPYSGNYNIDMDIPEMSMSNIHRICRSNQFLLCRIYDDLRQEIADLKKAQANVILDLAEVKEKVRSQNSVSSKEIDDLSKAFGKMKVSEDLAQKLNDIKSRVDSLQPAQLTEKAQPNFGWSREPYSLEFLWPKKPEENQVPQVSTSNIS